MKNTQTGHTLCDPDCNHLELVFPDPVISIAVKPKDKGRAKAWCRDWQDGCRRPLLPRRN